MTSTEFTRRDFVRDGFAVTAVAAGALARHSPTSADAPEQVLTPREHEVMDLLAEGCSNAEIASTLWIAPTTVRKHLENIYAKLGVRTRTAAVARLGRRR
jgi:DNA-binding CsgD family transcriptional regulator